MLSSLSQTALNHQKNNTHNHNHNNQYYDYESNEINSSKTRPNSKNSLYNDEQSSFKNLSTSSKNQFNYYPTPPNNLVERRANEQNEAPNGLLRVKATSSPNEPNDLNDSRYLKVKNKSALNSKYRQQSDNDYENNELTESTMNSIRSPNSTYILASSDQFTSSVQRPDISRSNRNGSSGSDADESPKFRTNQNSSFSNNMQRASSKRITDDSLPPLNSQQRPVSGAVKSSATNLNSSSFTKSNLVSHGNIFKDSSSENEEDRRPQASSRTQMKSSRSFNNSIRTSGKQADSDRDEESRFSPVKMVKPNLRVSQSMNRHVEKANDPRTSRSFNSHLGQDLEDDDDDDNIVITNYGLKGVRS